jgi:hypothetical protein
MPQPEQMSRAEVDEVLGERWTYQLTFTEDEIYAQKRAVYQPKPFWEPDKGPDWIIIPMVGGPGLIGLLVTGTPFGFFLGCVVGGLLPAGCLLADWSEARAANLKQRQAVDAWNNRLSAAVYWRKRYNEIDRENERQAQIANAKLEAERRRQELARQQELERQRQQERYDRAMADRLRARTAAEERFRQMLRDKTFELDVGQGINDPEIVAQGIRSALANSSWIASEDAMLLSLSTDQAIRETLGPLIARLPKPPPLLG